MIEKIKIEIDTHKKAISKIEMPQDLNVLEAAKIFQSLAMNMVNQIKLSEENGKVIPVKNKIITAS